MPRGRASSRPLEGAFSMQLRRYRDWSTSRCSSESGNQFPVIPGNRGSRDHHFHNLRALVFTGE